jgi:uncharacterized MAPEG superfamily protein
MDTLLICLSIAIVLPIVLAVASLKYRISQFGKPDLKTPRIQASQLEGAGHRIVAAQQNAWEALIMYTSTLVLMQLSNVAPATIATASIIFIAARVSHAVFYIADMAPLRFISFITGFGAIGWIIVQAFYA